jgi:hypothetical protein
MQLGISYPSSKILNMAGKVAVIRTAPEREPHHRDENRRSLHTSLVRSPHICTLLTAIRSPTSNKSLKLPLYQSLTLQLLSKLPDFHFVYPKCWMLSLQKMESHIFTKYT